MSTEEVYDFKGAVPKHYEEYLGPMFFEPYAIEVSNQLDPMKVNSALELAAGTGRVTRHLRNRLSPGARLVATDISYDMLTIAKEKLHDQSIEWMIMDAQELSFEDNSFDLVVCCFGLMFVPDKSKAYQEIFRVLKPGGQFLFSTWDSLDRIGPSSLYRSIAKKYLPDPVPEVYAAPFSMNDTNKIRQDLEREGFTGIIIQKIEKMAISESAAYAAEGMTMGGAVYNELIKSNPEAIPEIKKELEKQLSEKYGSAPMQAPMSAVIGEAKKP